MASNNSFYDDDRLNRAAVYLASTSPEIVSDCAELVRREGANLVPYLFTSDKARSSGHSRPFAIIGDAYIPVRAFENFWRGLCLIMMGSFRKPTLGENEWAEAFQHGYSIPGTLAKVLAAKVETDDILKPQNDQGGVSGAIRDMWTSVKEGAKSVVNKVSDTFGLPIHFEKNQDYDIDRTYEIAKAGEIVADLELRAQMVKGQLRMASDLGLMGSGDAEGDPHAAYAELGDAAYEVGTPMLPGTMYGGLFNLASLGRKASRMKLGNAASADKASAIGQMFMSLLGSQPVQAALANLTGGRGNGEAAEEGDALHKARTVREEYGDVVGDAYETGDIPALIGAIHSEGSVPHEQFTSGDPDTDAAIVDAILGDAEGDPVYGDALVGGLLTNMRIRRLKAKAARIRRRNMKRSGRQRRKDADLEALERAKAEVAAAEQGEGYQDYTGFQDTSYSPAQGQDGQGGNGSGGEVISPEGGGGADSQLPNFEDYSFQ